MIVHCRTHTLARAQARARGTALATLIVACAIVAHASDAAAAPVSVSVSGGFDYSTDSKAKPTRDAIAIGAVGLLGTDLFAGGLRYDNDAVGPGNGFIVGAGIPVAPLTQLRAMGTRFIGDGDYRAWRIKAGPMFKLPTGQTLGLYFTHDENNVAPTANGVVAEGNVSLVNHLSARATAGYAKSSEGDHTTLGTVGASWSPLHFLELSGEVGMTQNAAVSAGQPLPGSRHLLGGLPIIGGGSSGGGATGDQALSAVTSLVSLRITFP